MTPACPVTRTLITTLRRLNKNLHDPRILEMPEDLLRAIDGQLKLAKTLHEHEYARVEAVESHIKSAWLRTAYIMVELRENFVEPRDPKRYKLSEIRGELRRMRQHYAFP